MTESAPLLLWLLFVTVVTWGLGMVLVELIRYALDHRRRR